MKMQWKNSIFAFLLGCMFMFMITVMPISAASNSWLEVVINNVNIMLDGKVVGDKGVDYTLSNGNKVPYSILYKGTTYVPIRKLGELLNKEIGYIGESGTVVIGAMPEIQGPGWYLVKEEFTKTINPMKSGTFLGSTDYWETITGYSNKGAGNVALSTEYTTYNGNGVVGSVTRESYSYLWSAPATYIPVGGRFTTTASCTSTDGSASINGRIFNDSLNPMGDGSFYSIKSGGEATISTEAFTSGYDKNQRTVSLSLSIGTDATTYTYTYEYKK